MPNAGRGGDLYIRYPDGTLKNLTAEAGYGNAGFQGQQSIAVRDPCVHWDGAKAVFSMAIGATEKQYDHLPFYWQLYEIEGLGKDQTPIITRVPNQPEAYNNVAPIYGSDDRIIFTSDRPHNGQPPSLSPAGRIRVGLYRDRIVVARAGQWRAALAQPYPLGGLRSCSRQLRPGGIHPLGPSAARPAEQPRSLRRKGDQLVE